MRAKLKASLGRISLVLVLSLQACFLATSPSPPAKTQYWGPKFEICLAEKNQAEHLTSKCPDSKKIFRLSEINPDSNIFEIRNNSSTSFYFAKIKFCGRLNSLESMLRQLFAGAQDVHIKEIKNVKVEQKEALRSQTTLLLDDEQVYIVSFSTQNRCQEDWIYWSFNPSFFEPSQLVILAKITKELWQSH